MFDGHNGVRAADHATARLQELLASEPALRICTGDGPPASDAHEEEQLATAFRRAFNTVDTEILKVAKEEGATVTHRHHPRMLLFGMMTVLKPLLPSTRV